jgi:cytochrome c oxidase subunit 4
MSDTHNKTMTGTEPGAAIGHGAAATHGPARDAAEHTHTFDATDGGHHTGGHADGLHDEHAGGDEHHGPSLLLLAGIFVLLMLLTLLTVGITAFDFGYRLNLVIALAIAFVKAIFVGLYFMHLRWDPPIFAFTLVVSLGFVALFIGFTLLDTNENLIYLQEASVQRAGEQ